jgi:HlyD family secretion protein
MARMGPGSATSGLISRLGKTRMRWAMVAAVAIVVVLTVFAFIRPPAIAVEAAAVTRGPIDQALADEGQARVRETYVVSAPFEGEVERLPVEVGDAVIAGRTVVALLRASPATRLDPRARVQAEAAVASARAALSAATAQHAAAAAEATRSEVENQRTWPLASGAVSRQEAENVRNTAEAAKRSLQASEAAVQQRTAELASAEAALAPPGSAAGAATSVTSPAGGYVTRLLQQSQRIVGVGAPLVEVSDRNGLEAAIEFLSQDAVQIRPGDAAEIYDWGGPKPIPARVRRIEPQGFTKVSALGVEEQRAYVILQLEGDPAGWAGLEPGFRVWGRVFLKRFADAELVPTGALVRSGEGWAVFRIEGGRARLRAVRVGIITDRAAQILDGLSLGDRVVVFPSDDIKSGSRVKASASKSG